MKFCLWFQSPRRKTRARNGQISFVCDCDIWFLELMFGTFPWQVLTSRLFLLQKTKLLSHVACAWHVVRSRRRRHYGHKTSFVHQIIQTKKQTTRWSPFNPLACLGYSKPQKRGRWPSGPPRALCPQSHYVLGGTVMSKVLVFFVFAGLPPGNQCTALEFLWYV